MRAVFAADTVGGITGAVAIGCGITIGDPAAPFVPHACGCIHVGDDWGHGVVGVERLVLLLVRRAVPRRRIT
jgi:hypothetical protein